MLLLAFLRLPVELITLKWKFLHFNAFFYLYDYYTP